MPGNVYEKRLIEAYISENGTEPTTGAALTVEDLLDIQGSQTVRPRPPELTSIPALLGAFQQEWDALALEVFTLQQNLAQTRQELSTALYQQDAAVRVIARLTAERDAARDALRNINVAAPTNGDAMHVDSAPLPDSIIAKIDNAQAGLMKGRRKRPVPEEWATADNISLYKPTSSIKTNCAGGAVLDVNKSDNSALVGSRKGGAYVVQTASNSVKPVVPESESVTAGIWIDSRVAVGTASGKVKIIEKGQEVVSFDAHSAAVTGLSLHPSKEILASSSSDRSYALYDIEADKVLTQVQTGSGMFHAQVGARPNEFTDITCTAFHPDGHLLATGGQDGTLRIFDIKTGTVGGEVDLKGPAQAICFSENGTWLATATQGSSTVNIFDLRKLNGEGPVHTLTVEHVVESLDWDYTAQYLLIGGSEGTTVKQYSKSSKLWSEPLRAPVASSAARWGEYAQSILALDSSGALSVLSSA